MSAARLSGAWSDAPPSDAGTSPKAVAPPATDGTATTAPTLLSVEDFYGYSPMHSYIYVPTRELWPAPSVNARCAPVDVGAKSMKAADWLDKHRSVEQMTWAPGEPAIVLDRLISDGGWINRPGASCFNLYRPPQIERGDPQAAGPWIDHVEAVFPSDAAHIIRWLAHRVQHPGQKVNHALVLGGTQGIGKDTVLEPVKYAVGPWNFADVSPTHLLGRFNGFVKSVILRISEARDLGDVDRFAFYDHTKVYTAAPPDVLRCDEKHIREHAALNVCGVVVTTNHKTDGLYLPPDDRRHFVAWSDSTRESFGLGYWNKLYGWFHEGGLGHVAAYLADLDLTDFDAKAPPPKTPAFWDVVDANRAPEDAEVADALDSLKSPPAVTITDIKAYACEAFAEWLDDRRNRRQIPHRLESAGYVPVRNETAKDGLWVIGGRRQQIYAKRELSVRDRYVAAMSLAKPGR